ncbi:MAG: flavodoxin [Actinomyces sp.]|uniref:flavodoxin n=1 Tax=Actinomyces sp. TaxID=29317 RepID=UPI0026DA7AC9|nr:flavodoxin [Actinomyces sp.]MDO4242993.1 flavodoxin [Actinomyces sp.]
MSAISAMSTDNPRPDPPQSGASDPRTPTGALVVVESFFGCTRAVAHALAAGLADAGVSVHVTSTDDAPGMLPAALGLLVLAAPTHSRGLPTAASRAQAVSPGAPSTPSTGIREWLEATIIPAGLPVAAADTVTGRGWLSGSAAKDVAKTLTRRSSPRCRLQELPRGSAQGPLADGEEAAARAWGRTGAQTCLSHPQ